MAIGLLDILSSTVPVISKLTSGDTPTGWSSPEDRTVIFGGSEGFSEASAGWIRSEEFGVEDSAGMNGGGREGAPFAVLPP